MVPDLLVIDIDSHGTILHLEPFDLTLAYPDWYDALCTRIRRHGSLEAGDVFVWERKLRPATIVGAVSTHHWVAKAHAGDVDRALATIAEVADRVDARKVSVGALGTRNGLRIGYVISRIERHLARNDRTIGVMLNDEDDGGSQNDTNVILPSKTVTFVWDDMLCRARRVPRRRLPGTCPWIITLHDPIAESTIEFMSDDLNVLRPVSDDERALYCDARVYELPRRETFEIGERLVPSASTDRGPSFPLPWNDSSVRMFLHREAREMAICKSTGTAVGTPDPVDLDIGRYVGKIVWGNEGFLLQRIDGAVRLHALPDLRFCAHCALRIGNIAEISYRNGTGSVRAWNARGCDADASDTPAVRVSRREGIDLRDADFAVLRPSGFAPYAAELAIELMMSRPRRRAFARLVSELRRNRRLVLRSGVNDSDDVDVRVLADVIASRYGPWLSAKRLPLAT